MVVSLREILNSLIHAWQFTGAISRYGLGDGYYNSAKAHAYTCRETGLDDDTAARIKDYLKKAAMHFMASNYENEHFRAA